MGMTIEEIKNELRSDLTIKRMTGDDYSESLRDCLAQLLVIAEKYQKIEEIIDQYYNSMKISTVRESCAFEDIVKVVKDGNT